jgi:hypothetical protein
MVLYGAAALFSPIFGKIAEKFTIIPVFIFYWALTLGTSVFMLFWQGNPENTFMLFLLAFLLGTIESINTPLPRGKLVEFESLIRFKNVFVTFKLFMV